MKSASAMVEGDRKEMTMTIQELERDMVEYGIVIRAIPHYNTSTVEVRHKDIYPEGVEYFDPRFNRKMLKVTKTNHHGGKYIITKQTDTGQMVSFYNPRYFDSVEDAVNAFLADVEEERKQYGI